MFLCWIEGENVVDIEQEDVMCISNQFVQVVRIVFKKKTWYFQKEYLFFFFLDNLKQSAREFTYTVSHCSGGTS